AQQLKPNLYNGSVIGKTDVVVTESSAEQVFWSQYSVQTDGPNLSGTIIVEVPNELPKVSMVNSCLKKLKFHLASFDMVVKERTTATAITEGTWGFKHTKACFRDDIIPFVKNLKELFTSFDQCLIDEVTEVQNIFKQMELAVEQDCAEKTKFQTKMESVLQENDRLLTQALSVEIVNIVLHDNVKFDYLNVNACAHCRDTVSSPESALTFVELFEINDLKAQVQEKDTVILKLREKLNSLSGDVKERKSVEVSDLNAILQEKVLVITALKEQLNKLKGKEVLTEAVSLNPIDPALLQVDVAPLVPKLRKNRTAHTDYIRHTQKEAATLREIVKRVTLVSSASGSKSQDNTNKNRIRQTQKKAKKTELEDQLRIVKSSLNKASVVDSKATSFVIKSVSNMNSNLKCASRNGCLFSDNHDACVVEYINSVNASKKSKSVKPQVKRKVWKSTGKVFKTVGYIWKPTGRTFTLVGNVCPLTSIATATIVPPRESILIVKSTDKPVVTLVYTRKPKAKKVPNKMEPNNSWGSSSNVSSSLTDCRLSI
nr:hypothetical protein [Tanacetum cinerariifolium]